MKRLILATLASGLAIAAATPASAAIFISYSTDGGATKTALTLVGAPGNTGFTGTVGIYDLNLSAQGMPVLTSPNFTTNTISAASNSSTASTLTLYFTQTDQAAYSGALNSAFSVTRLQGSAQNVNLASYYNTTNANGSLTGVAPGTLLQTQTFTANGSNGANGVNNLVVAPGLFSTTAVYTLNFGATGAGRINAGVDVTSAVPEPATWGMMILGFGMMGGVLRRRSTKVAFA